MSIDQDQDPSELNTLTDLERDVCWEIIETGTSPKYDDRFIEIIVHAFRSGSKWDFIRALCHFMRMSPGEKLEFFRAVQARYEMCDKATSETEILRAMLLKIKPENDFERDFMNQC